MAIERAGQYDPLAQIAHEAACIFGDGYSPSLHTLHFQPKYIIPSPPLPPGALDIVEVVELATPPLPPLLVAPILPAEVPPDEQLPPPPPIPRLGIINGLNIVDCLPFPAIGPEQVPPAPPPPPLDEAVEGHPLFPLTAVPPP